MPQSLGFFFLLAFTGDNTLGQHDRGETWLTSMPQEILRSGFVTSRWHKDDGYTPDHVHLVSMAYEEEFDISLN